MLLNFHFVSPAKEYGKFFGVKRFDFVPAHVWSDIWSERSWNVAISKRNFFNSTEFRAMMPIVGEANKELSIDFQELKEPQDLMDTILKYYSNTMISMKWQGINSQKGPKLIKSFPNLGNLFIENSELKDNLLQFNK